VRFGLLNLLGCPECGNGLTLHAIEKGPDGDVVTGLLLCGGCRLMYPVYDSVPRMFPYSLDEYKSFVEENRAAISEHVGFSLPSGSVPKGEEFVKRSFSRQWDDYDYSGVLWNFTYEQRLRLFLWEVNMRPEQLAGHLVFDGGCGNGVISNLIAEGTGAEVVGMDISSGVVAAAHKFAANKRLHFVQGTLFRPPFRRGAFDVVYSHGVLHHTNNTRKAFLSIAPLCRPGGRCYVWLYGEYRRFVWLFNLVTNSIRTVVSRLPPAVQNPVVVTLAHIYGWSRRNLRRYVLRYPAVEYNWTQTLHVARDRFTPLYAHTHRAEDVKGWFREAGFPSPMFRPHFFDDPIWVGGVAVYGDRPTIS